MFRPFMEALVMSYMPNRLVVTIESRSASNLNMKVLKKIMDPLYLTHGSN